MAIEALGGIRLVRKLGEGARAEVYLARVREGDDDTVAIKTFRPHVDPLSITAEIEALSRAEGTHVLSLIDLTTAQTGAHAMILKRLVGGSLARLMRDREEFAAGEAITILAPLAVSLARVHRSGAVHGGIRADAILFDESGAPILSCFGRAFPIPRDLSTAALSEQPGVALDLSAFAGLARAVLARVDDPGMRGLSDFAHPGPALESHDWFERFSDRLFELADACPIAFSSASDPAAGRPELGLPSRIPATPAGHYGEPSAVAIAVVEDIPMSPWYHDEYRRSPRAAAETAPTPATVTQHRPPVQRVSARLRGVWAGLGDRVGDEATGRLERVRAMLKEVRPRLWVIAGIVSIGWVVAVLGIPSLQPPPGSTIAPSVAPTSSPADDGALPAVGSDSPEDAIASLLSERQRCIAQLSVLCLDGVDQPGSAAMAADQLLVRELQSGAEMPAPWGIDRSRVTLTERLGDSALVEISDPGETEPASILAMKGEAGWRIRDYLSK